MTSVKNTESRVMKPKWQHAEVEPEAMSLEDHWKICKYIHVLTDSLQCHLQTFFSLRLFPKFYLKPFQGGKVACVELARGG